MYVDGSDLSFGTGIKTGTYVAMHNHTMAAIIGGVHAGSITLDATIDGLGIWNKELTSEEVTSIYNTQNGGLEIL